MNIEKIQTKWENFLYLFDTKDGINSLISTLITVVPKWCKFQIDLAIEEKYTDIENKVNEDLINKINNVYSQSGFIIAVRSNNKDWDDGDTQFIRKEDIINLIKNK